MIIQCGLKIDLLVSEPHEVKFLLQTPSTVHLFEFLTSDK